MDATSIIILGVMGPIILLCIIGIPIVLHINKKEREEQENAEKTDTVEGAAAMKCFSCGAEVSPGTATDVTDLGSCLVIVRNVPCHKCTHCDETIYTGDVAKRLEEIVAAAKMAVNEIAIVDYAA